jgi:hypothetical protein
VALGQRCHRSTGGVSAFGRMLPSARLCYASSMNLLQGRTAGLVIVVAFLVGCRVEAHQVKSDGARPAPDDAATAATEPSCGGIAAFRCPANMYCLYAPFQKCGAGDAMGKCKPRPEVCTEEYNPVCGCDGKEHGNACAAARAGTSVQKEGTCK